MVNVAELLKEASYGMELYSTIFGVVYLKGVSDNTNIAVYDKNKISRYFNKYGQYFDNFPDAECQLFPAKGQSWDDWKHTVEFAKTSFDIHKFKIGDWIISKDETERVYQITDIKNGRYFYNNTSKYDYIKVTDTSYDLWDMANAKDGDILYSLDSKKPFIYKYREPNSQATAYCGINKFNEFFVWQTKKCIICTDKYIPATEDQCNWLFKEMENAGYTWDPANKKLNKKTKFKIGDWIIRNDGYSDVPAQIYNLKKDRYLVTNMLGSKGDVMLTWQDKWHIWTINDAKSGDILNANGAVFIYKKHNKDYVYHYCGINLGNEFVIGTDDSIWNANNEIYPATQEQKDLLFNKIKEAGYTWDLNSNTLYSNTLTRKTKFKIGDWIISKEKDRFYQITDIRGKKYFYNNTVKYDYINIADDLYDLWTIDVAKPGDILCYKDEISIYKNSITDSLDKFAGFQYYCCYDGKRLWTDSFYALTEKDKPDIHPATEEQIETLFSYMTPAGYIWDFNNKTLKKTKFKIGNWIVNNEDKNISQITEIICDEKDPNILYGYVHTNGFFANKFEDNYHLWAIKDAKKGDILSAKIDGDDYILIFKQIKDGWIETYGHYYITIDKFCVPTQLFCRDYQGTLHPATQEQCKTLFKKMRDDGYKWDPDKKVLTNRNKPHYDIANFHAGMPVLVRILDKHKWCYLLFSHCYKHQGILHFHAGGAGWLQCIPFNKDTEHLLGTSDMCSEEYVNW